MAPPAPSLAATMAQRTPHPSVRVSADAPRPSAMVPPLLLPIQRRRCLTTTMRKPLRCPGHYHRRSQPPLFNPFQLDRRARSRCQLSYRAGWQWATQRWISTALNAPLTNEPYSKISGNFKPIYTNPNLPARFLIRRTASRLYEGVVCSLHNSNSFDLPVLQQLGVCSHPSTKPPSRP